MSMRADERLKRLLILSLGIAGVLGLFVQALGNALPWAVLKRRIAFFAASDRPARIAKSVYFRQDESFALSLLSADQTWPRSVDVVVEVGPGVQTDWAEDVRRRAAYLLAPRRVFLRTSAEPGVRLLIAGPRR
jgi:hypothetical protein